MDTISFTISNLWVMISAFLVFIMHLGFATLEAGLTRSKNTVNIIFKNVAIVSIGLITYAFWGFNLMYPGVEGRILEFSGFGLSPGSQGDTPAYNPNYTYWTDFLFQAMFAATAATIVSGAVAERIKLNVFLLFSIIYVGLVYPIAGYWHWGKGWLYALGFHDFAGSTIVHSVGGWAALVGVIFLGPRIGKYNGKVKAIEGHNLPLAAIGVFLLWFGWFGFNGGSVLSADPGLVSKVLVVTSLSAAVGSVSAFLISFLLFKSYDLTMMLNGILAGLVGITAGADLMSPTDAMIIGLIAGALVVLGVILLDKIKIDDPVGAIPVHLICGIWGTLAVSLFGSKAGGEQFITQSIGILAIGVLCALSSSIIFMLFKMTMGIRVSTEEELEGLDLHEHGMKAYADFRANDH